MSNMTMKLVRRAQKGDEIAYEMLLDMFDPLVKKHSYYNGCYQEDIEQELKIRIYHCVSKFRC